MTDGQSVSKQRGSDDLTPPGRVQAARSRLSRFLQTLRRGLARLLGGRRPAMQVAAICRDADGRVLMITSRGTGRWIIPKGWPMPGRSLADAAMQEAWEEAGVTGTPEPRELGRYHYDKVQSRGFAIPVEVRVFVIRVETLATEFPEAGERERKWFPPTDAARLVAEPELRDLLNGLRAPR